jgi:type III pantothenate kinase
MILEIDAGNSRIKWRILNSSKQVADRGFCFAVSELAKIQIDDVQRARIASVRGGDFASGLADLLQERWQIEPEFARVTPHQAGVRNAYSKFESLGVDRWLAILTAFNRRNSQCCVISCGTAVTIDVVSNGGVHLGGFIVPGLLLQRKALLENTLIRLPPATQWSSNWSAMALGSSTEHAVNHGIFTMLVSGIASLPVVAEVAAAGGLFLTGGDAEIVSRGLTEFGINNSCDQDIILDGLAWAMP